MSGSDGPGPPGHPRIPARAPVWALVVLVAVPLLVIACLPLLLQSPRPPYDGSGSASTTTPSGQQDRPGHAPLLAADFDELPLGPVTPSGFVGALGGDEKDPGAYDDTSVVRDDRPGQGHALRVTLESGTIRTQPAGNNGIVVLIALGPTDVSRACMSYDVRFDPSFEWSLGGKLPGLLGVAPGVSPTLPSAGRRPGDLGWSSRVMWLGSGARPIPGLANTGLSYVYGPQQAGSFGDDLLWRAPFVAGRWQQVKQCLVLNTPGRPDGVLRVWLDHRLVLDRSDHTFRTRADVLVTHVAWSVFRGGNTIDWAADRTDTVDFDNVRVTRR